MNVMEHFFTHMGAKREFFSFLLEWLTIAHSRIGHCVRKLGLLIWHRTSVEFLRLFAAQLAICPR